MVFGFTSYWAAAAIQLFAPQITQMYASVYQLCTQSQCLYASRRVACVCVCVCVTILGRSNAVTLTMHILFVLFSNVYFFPFCFCATQWIALAFTFAIH